MGIKRFAGICALALALFPAAPAAPRDSSELLSDVERITATSSVEASFPIESLSGAVIFYWGRLRDMPPGFVPCDGRQFNPDLNRNLFNLMGLSNRVPDMRWRHVGAMNDVFHASQIATVAELEKAGVNMEGFGKPDDMVMSNDFGIVSSVPKDIQKLDVRQGDKPDGPLGDLHVPEWETARQVGREMSAMRPGAKSSERAWDRKRINIEALIKSGTMFEGVGLMCGVQVNEGLDVTDIADRPR